MNKPTGRFMGWKDLVMTPAVEAAILALSFFCALKLKRLFGFDFLSGLVLFYAIQVFWTLCALKIMRVLSPLEEGVYAGDSIARYAWNLNGFLCATNLSLLCFSDLLSPLLRKHFYALLGARMGKGIIVISGNLQDPYLISIEENALVGNDAILISHALTASDLLILGRIEVKRGAMIGARSILMPDVIVGEGAMVNAMSLVPMGTRIGAYEVWGGVPAKKIGDLPRGLGDAGV